MPGFASDSSLPPRILALIDHLEDYDHGTRQRAKAYLRGKAIQELWQDGDTVAATIQGSDVGPYTTTLTYEDDQWEPDCSCPVGGHCKHTHALATRWLEDLFTGRAVQQAKATPPVSPGLPSTPRPSRKGTFRQIWEPQLATKLGRDLTDEEGCLLGQLSALFHDFRRAARLTKHALHQHGFAVGPQPLLQDHWTEALPDWWSRNQPPADPWALWQYIALHWEREGRPLPEVLAPMTDLTAVRRAVAEKFLAEDVRKWRRALPPPNPHTDDPADATAQRLIATYDDARICLSPDHGAHLQTRPANGKPWRNPTQKWLRELSSATFPSLQAYPEPARSLLTYLRLELLRFGTHALSQGLIPEHDLSRLLTQPATRAAVVLPDGSPARVEDTALQLHARPQTDDPTHLDVILVHPDGHALPHGCQPVVLHPHPLYLIEGKLWRGPPPLPASRLPIAVLSDPEVATGLKDLGLRLPATLEARIVAVPLQPLLRLWIEAPDAARYQPYPLLRVQLFATAEDPPIAQTWAGHQGWQWCADRRPAPPTADTPHYRYDLTAANAVGATFGAFRLEFYGDVGSWTRVVTATFPEDFLAWRATLPPGLKIEATPDLAGLILGPLRAHYQVSATPASSSGQDWFDVTVDLQPEDTTLSEEELRLLLAARGRWVQLPRRGWQRLELDPAADEDARVTLDRLGLASDPTALLATQGRAETHRYHALQLAEVPLADEALTHRLRDRAATLRAVPPPPLPAGLQGVLRPYQEEGYHYLAHLATHGLGGILADDMGLGKTLQTLAWLLWLRQKRSPDEGPFRALVVCPKSVVPNWGQETARFAPALTTGRLEGKGPTPDVALLVINYAQLRLRATDLKATDWDAVILDEGQNIKNPTSVTARVARDLRTRHRLVLTGTPIENRLLDLWSLLAFAQPGLLGTQAAFTRNYHEKEDPAGARSRLAGRVKPFILRRTKSQVARDLPARTEEDLVCELEGAQRTLYDAELKRARQLLLKVKTARQFDTQRFNILQSLLRLRQICCDPRLVGAESTPPTKPTASAKLEALLDTIEPIVAEGQRVLIFSQFVTMLELIRDELRSRHIDHLILTGQTENREELVARFQAAAGPPVFLLSLKAAGAGLNLTAASYVVLFDPWWNPAVEAQAIDRTHRIGQTNPVIAYRLIARDTVEEKIRALQRDKAALAAAVVQEENVASLMDLDTLREVLG